MINRARRIWLGVGLAATAGTYMLAEAEAQSAKHSGHSAGVGNATGPADTSTSAQTSGAFARPQAGEAYLTDGGPKDTRIRIYRDIVLMQGHLLVADELVRLERWDDALPHVLHPTEELYGLMERYIKLHKVTPFDTQLRAIGQAVKAKRIGAYEQAAKIANQRLSAALEKFKTFMVIQPMSNYAMRTIVEVLKVTKLEYEASIENGAFSKIVEYQDSRGFVWIVERMLSEFGADLEKRDAAHLAQLRSLIVELKSAWPSVLVPERPAMTVADLSARVDRLVEIAEAFRW